MPVRTLFLVRTEPGMPLGAAFRGILSPKRSSDGRIAQPLVPVASTFVASVEDNSVADKAGLRIGACERLNCSRRRAALSIPCTFTATEEKERERERGGGRERQINTDTHKHINTFPFGPPPSPTSLVLPGDEVLEVDGESCSGAGCSATMRHLNANEGTVTLVVRFSSDYKRLVLHRNKVETEVGAVGAVGVCE